MVAQPELGQRRRRRRGCGDLGQRHDRGDRAVSAANSLVGSTANDIVGGSLGVTALTNGNYVVASSNWDNGAVVNAGAVTWGSGTTGVTGAVSAANSLVGSTANDNVGGSGVTALSNGNYVVRSPFWDNGAVVNAGAATWGSGTTGVTGAVSAANSLVGSTANDVVGGSGVTALSNGNYVVRSPSWDNGAVADAGAVTWGSGTTGVTGRSPPPTAWSAPRPTMSSDSRGVTALPNGNYVVLSWHWDNGAVADAGAATWGSGTTGVTGAVSAANSLVGSTASDRVGIGVTALSNGNYVVAQPVLGQRRRQSTRGAATWGSGTTGRNRGDLRRLQPRSARLRVRVCKRPSLWTTSTTRSSPSPYGRRRASAGRPARLSTCDRERSRHPQRPGRLGPLDLQRLRPGRFERRGGDVRGLAARPRHVARRRRPRGTERRARQLGSRRRMGAALPMASRRAGSRRQVLRRGARFAGGGDRLCVPARDVGVGTGAPRRCSSPSTWSRSRPSPMRRRMTSW